MASNCFHDSTLTKLEFTAITQVQKTGSSTRVQRYSGQVVPVNEEQPEEPEEPPVDDTSLAKLALRVRDDLEIIRGEQKSLAHAHAELYRNLTALQATRQQNLIFDERRRNEKDPQEALKQAAQTLITEAEKLQRPDVADTVAKVVATLDEKKGQRRRSSLVTTWT